MALAIMALALLWICAGSLPLPLPEGNDAVARLAYAARWLLLPGLTLLAGVGFVANRRFFTADGIDGSPSPQSRSLDVALRYNRNTLEQVVLAAIGWAGLALALPHDRLNLIAGLAVLFTIGRALFWAGYLAAPWARALGFGLTFYPTVAVYAWLLLRV
jgi:MAPEG family protein